jgi:hypothetical protein
MALFVPVAPIVAVEGLGPFASLSRSTRLTRARYMPTLGIALLMGLTSWLLSTALSALPQLLAGWVGLERGWPILAAGAIAAEVIVVPFVAASTVLLYLDLRVRTEGSTSRWPPATCSIGATECSCCWRGSGCRSTCPIRRWPRQAARRPTRSVRPRYQ